MIRKTLVLLTGLLILTAPFCGNCEPVAGELLSIETEQGTHTLNVEVAATHESRQAGLMFRESMPESSGMLFCFSDDTITGFWMKNTLIPLDMIFIKRDGTVSSVRANARPLDETSIYSEEPVRAVLEINGGEAAKLGIKRGDTVRHDFFGNGGE